MQARRPWRQWGWMAMLAITACDGDDSGRDVWGVQGASASHPGPQFPGAGTSGSGQAIAGATLGCDAPAPFGAKPAPGAQGTLQCFYGSDDPVHPAATVEWIVEASAAVDLVHVKLTLNPAFVDNSYGANAIGWDERAATDAMPPPKDPTKPGKAPPMPKPGKGGHTFRDLVGSDHAEFKLVDATGKLSLHFKADYLSEDRRAPSGYATLGVGGGDGKVLFGSAADVVAVSTSLDRNLNACGLGDFTESSPATDLLYTPGTLAPDWDYRVVYDVWVRRSAFGAAGFGNATVDFVHASPSKRADHTVDVVPGDCPPSWPPYCSEPDGCCRMVDAMCVPNWPPPREPDCIGEGCPIAI
jgi:hypothetical protein